MRPDAARPDPFDVLVELTAAAMAGRPPREFVYPESGPSLLARLANAVQFVRLASLEAGIEAANEPDARLLQRYY